MHRGSLYCLHRVTVCMCVCERERERERERKREREKEEKREKEKDRERRFSLIRWLIVCCSFVVQIYAEGSPPEIPQSNEKALVYFKKAIEEVRCWQKYPCCV